MGQNHLRVITELKSCELVFLWDIDQSLANRLGRKYNTFVPSNPEEGFHLVDAIIICTPTFTHADYIKTVSQKIGNIFVEKPMCQNLREAEDIEKLVKAKNLNLQVGFIERFNPAVGTLKTLLDDTEEVVSISFTRTNRLSDRIKDVDVITDLMIHDIDLALY